MEYAHKYWNDLAQRKLEEGREEGREEGQKAALLRLLGLKFTDISVPHHAKVSAASPEQIYDWTARIFVAQTIDELLT